MEKGADVVVSMDGARRLPSYDEQTIPRPLYILLVENESRFQGVIREVIVSDSELELAAVCAGKREALRVIATRTLDIMLVSLNLADGAGLDLVQAMKRAQPKCGVWVMGTSLDKEGFFSSIQAGAAGCLLKENFLLPEAACGNSIVSSLAFSRFTGRLPAASEAGAGKKPTVSQLSPVQAEVLRCVAAGLSNKEIARNLVMSTYNVDYHLKCLRKRFSVRNRVQLTTAAITLFPA